MRREYFNPRSLHGERPHSRLQFLAYSDFNPRSLHGERLSVEARCSQVYCISIHAPCTGSDTFLRTASIANQHFNPRSLHGERRIYRRLIRGVVHFNPRSLHGERQSCTGQRFRHLSFQSTLPARGATCDVLATYWETHFNPRSLHGERRKRRRLIAGWSGISIHAPCTGSDPSTLRAGICPF